MGIVQSCDCNRNNPGVFRYKYETKSQNAKEESGRIYKEKPKCEIGITYRYKYSRVSRDLLSIIVIFLSLSLSLYCW